MQKYHSSRRIYDAHGDTGRSEPPPQASFTSSNVIDNHHFEGGGIDIDGETVEFSFSPTREDDEGGAHCINEIFASSRFAHACNKSVKVRCTKKEARAAQIARASLRAVSGGQEFRKNSTLLVVLLVVLRVFRPLPVPPVLLVVALSLALGKWVG